MKQVIPDDTMIAHQEKELLRIQSEIDDGAKWLADNNDDLQHALTYRVNVPFGVSGKWEVVQLIIDDSRAYSSFLTACLDYKHRGFSPTGIYTKLLCGGVVVMSDTPDEIRGQFLPFIERAHGNVLITGLGLGLVVDAVLKKPDVTAVTVVELSPDVISLTGGTYRSRYPDRLRIVNASAFDWMPDQKFDVAWHDIWTYISPDNLPEMEQMKKHYRDHVGEQFFWVDDICSDNELWGKGWGS